MKLKTLLFCEDYVHASFSLFIISHVMQSMEAGVEQERLQQEAELNQRVNEEEVQFSLTTCKEK